MAGPLEHSTLRVRRTPVVDGNGDIEDAQLVVLVGHATGRRYPVADHVVLGRGGDSPVEVLDDGVSRQHAEIVRGSAGYVIRDLESRNGTYVNGERIDEHPLRFGDKIAVGSRTVLLFANRDRFEDQRVQAQKLQALGQLSGGVAHDFNNLLGVVLANASHLRRTPDLKADVLEPALMEIETAARRAVDLTRQLLSFARSAERRHTPVDVGAAVADAERLLRRTLDRSIELKINVQPGLATVGDESQILQVLMNLCINAGDAMAGGGVLAVSVQGVVLDDGDIAQDELLTAGRYIKVEVEDDGAGIDPAVLPRVFEPFFTTKPRGQGTGLGLATAAAIVQDHGGAVRLVSQVGQGTCFTILLPAAATGVELASRETTGKDLSLSGVVLLADDEPLIRSSTSRVLEHAGLEVILATDGEEAVAVFGAHRYRLDLVILDLDMPRQNGEAAFAKIRALAPGVPVLISSGYVDPTRAEALRAAGVDDILTKPYDSATLVRAVARVLHAATQRGSPPRTEP